MKSRFVVLIILAALFPFNSNTLASELPSVTKVETERVDQKTQIGHVALDEQVSLTVDNLRTLLAESDKTIRQRRKLFHT
jgi:biopolymer transport protein ExbD